MPQLLIPPGFLFLHKPADITSHACIRTIKRLLPAKAKIGHGGALDPLATGILLVGIGRKATMHLGAGLTWPKTYTVRVKMGIATDTLDREGVTLETCIAPQLTQQALTQVASALTGAINQIPPIFSALKHQGRSLCRHARDGEFSPEKLITIAQEKTRLVEIYSLEIRLLEYPFFEFTAHVSKGTYVRSLAQSILGKIHTIGTVDAIFRTQVGPFSLKNSITLEQLISPAKLSNLMIGVPDFSEAIDAFSQNQNGNIIDNNPNEP